MEELLWRLGYGPMNRRMFIIYNKPTRCNSGSIVFIKSTRRMFVRFLAESPQTDGEAHTAPYSKIYAVSLPANMAAVTRI